MRLVVTCFICLLTFRAGAAVSPRLAFTVEDCEAFLLGPKGQNRLKRFSQWLAHLPAIPLEVNRRDTQLRDIEENYTRLLQILLTEDFDELSTEELVERVRNFKQMHGPSDDPIEPDEPAEPPLSPLERTALGLGSQEDKTFPSELRAEIEASPTKENVRIAVYRDKKVIGSVLLPFATIHQGFYNTTSSWQSMRAYEANLIGKAAPPPRPKAKRIETFFNDQERFLLTRQVGNIQFGYLFEYPPPGLETDLFFLEIYIVRECRRPPVNLHEVFFPKIGQPSGLLNLCLFETGLTLSKPV